MVRVNWHSLFTVQWIAILLNIHFILNYREYTAEQPVPTLNLPSTSSRTSQSQQNALTVLAEEKMELLSQLKLEQGRAGRYEMELSQLKVQTETVEREYREAMGKFDGIYSCLS